FSFAALCSKRKRAARAGRERRRRVIDLAQFVGADTGRHVSMPLISTLRMRPYKSYFAQSSSLRGLPQSAESDQVPVRASACLEQKAHRQECLCYLSGLGIIPE